MEGQSLLASIWPFSFVEGMGVKWTPYAKDRGIPQGLPSSSYLQGTLRVH